MPLARPSRDPLVELVAKAAPRPPELTACPLKGLVGLIGDGVARGTDLTGCVEVRGELQKGVVKL